MSGKLIVECIALVVDDKRTLDFGGRKVELEFDLPEYPEMEDAAKSMHEAVRRAAFTGIEAALRAIKDSYQYSLTDSV